METSSTPRAEGPPDETVKLIGCAHYKRKSKFVSPCCDKIYVCRFCHDENEDHTINRKEVTELVCAICDTRQKVQRNCEKCGVQFGKYTCLECNLFDDEDKRQYHCSGCGICRIGGADRFFHCETCNMCLPMQLKNAHKCVENVSRSNCPVCLEDIHTSRVICHVPPCGHLLHRPCFERMLKFGLYACPICQTSLVNMERLWKYWDEEVENTPMPEEYRNCYVGILCKDCHKEGTVKFHVVGFKCNHCGSYNTCRVRGPVIRIFWEGGGFVKYLGQTRRNWSKLRSRPLQYNDRNLVRPRSFVDVERYEHPSYRLMPECYFTHSVGNPLNRRYSGVARDIHGGVGMTAV